MSQNLAARLDPRSWSPSRLPARLRLPLAVYAACQTVLFLWWGAFYPGRASGDTMTYLYEVTTSHWRGDHSVAYDSLLWLSVELTGGVAVLTFLQTVAMSAALAYACVGLRDLGVRGRWSAPAAITLTLLPPTGSFVPYVWKDVAFTIATIVAFGAILQLTGRRLRGDQGVRDRSFKRQMLVLGLGCLGIGLFRNNGFPVLIAAGVLLVLLLPGMRRWMLAATAIPLVVTLLCNNVVYPALGVQTPRADEVYAFNYADIAVAYTKRPDTFTAADVRLLHQVAPMSWWSGRAAANCHEADSFMHPPLNRQKAGRINGQFLSLWTRILERTPSLIIDARLCRADIAWSFTGHTGMYPVSNKHLLDTWTMYGYAHAKDVPYGSTLRERPLSTKLFRAASKSFTWSKKPGLQPYLWRGCNWTYLGYLVLLLVMLARRRRYELLAVAALPIGLQLTVIAANPSPLWRYMCASIFLGVLTVPMLALLARSGPARPGAAARGAEAPDAVTGPPTEGDQDAAPVSRG